MEDAFRGFIHVKMMTNAGEYQEYQKYNKCSTNKNQYVFQGIQMNETFFVRFQQICIGKRCLKKKCSEDEDCPARSKCHPTNKICRGNRYLV